MFLKIKDVLWKWKTCEKFDLDDEEKIIVKDAFLITMKPILYVATFLKMIWKEDNEYAKEVKNTLSEEGNFKISVKVEEDLTIL